MEKTFTSSKNKYLTNGTLKTDEKEKKFRKTAKCDPDNEDGVLLDDNNSSDGNKKNNEKDCRYTPLEERKPKIVFFQDPNLEDEYKKIKESQIQRRKADSRNSIQQVDMSLKNLRDEIKQMRSQKSRKDCYSIVPEVLSHNPFMTKLMKSSDFSPSAGVKHKDDVQLANSPSIDGGTFKAP